MLNKLKSKVGIAGLLLVMGHSVIGATVFFVGKGLKETYDNGVMKENGKTIACKFLNKDNC